jgi:hypothetical protein
MSRDHGKQQDVLRVQHAEQLSAIQQQHAQELQRLYATEDELLRRVQLDGDLLQKTTQRLNENESVCATVLAEVAESRAAHQQALRELQMANETSARFKSSRDHYEELFIQARGALDSERLVANEYVAAAMKKAGTATAEAVARAVEAEANLKGARARIVVAEQSAADSQRRAEDLRLQLRDTTRELDDASRLSYRAMESPSPRASAYATQDASSLSRSRLIGGSVRGFHGR